MIRLTGFFVYLYHSHSHSKQPAAMDRTDSDGDYEQMVDSDDPDNEANSRPMEGTDTSNLAAENCVNNHVNEDPISPIDSIEYKMHRRRRGKAIIFNHIKFSSNLKDRIGARADAESLEVFESLGFEIDYCEDFPLQKLKNKLKEVAAEDHTDADCLVVVVMSHGEQGIISAEDRMYEETELWERFTGDKCSSLLGKPKLFFIQACRGERIDDGVEQTYEDVQKNTESIKKISTYTIPNTADLLIAHATFDDYIAWRDTVGGSWFIQALCEELNQNVSRFDNLQRGKIVGPTTKSSNIATALRPKTCHQIQFPLDMLSLMTLVNKSVAIQYKTETDEIETNNKKQMPIVSSTLTKFLYLDPKPVVKYSKPVKNVPTPV